MPDGREVAELGRPDAHARKLSNAFLAARAGDDPQVARDDLADSFRYVAFLSYAHEDSTIAQWLHNALERYRVPSHLVGRATATGRIPARLIPIFRDRHELAAANDLGREIREALAGSRFLIVLCSPAGAASRWTAAEVDAFKRLRPDGCILAAIVAGEPFASEMPGREREECFPAPLRQAYDERGRPTKKRAEPIAADLRAGGDGKKLGFLKIVAGMLGIGLDELVQRETQRRQKRLTYIAAASLAGMAVTSGLAVYAFDKRDEARDQRREAEGLVGFMLGDLRAKLEPIGRLDALDAVGGRALQYFEMQDKTDLSDAALAQQSKALTMMGEIASTRGDLDGALRRYREAMAGTAEALRRAPDDPSRLFDHAQNVFWIGEIARLRGQLEQAERAYRTYHDLAERMVAIDPANRKWQMEVQYAATNLGIVLYEQRRYADAIPHLQRGLTTIETLAAAEPGNLGYQKSQLAALAWLADAYYGHGLLDEAIAKRERQAELIDQLMRRFGRDVGYRERAIPAYRALGRMLAARGELDSGIERTRRAVGIGRALIPTEPENMVWVELTAGAQLDLAELLLTKKRINEAAAETRSACDLARRLAGRNQGVVEWQTLDIDCLDQRARVALMSGSQEQALGLAKRALAAARSSRTNDTVGDRIVLAGALKSLGDVHASMGDEVLARQAWQRALASLPRLSTESPRHLALRAALLTDVGRREEGKQLEQRLAAMGHTTLP